MARSSGTERASLVVPAPEQRDELQNYLRGDDSALADVWRGLEAGQSAADIQRTRGAASKNFVWNYRQKLRALLDGEMPESTSLAGEIAGLFRALAKKGDISEGTRNLLLQNARSIGSELPADRYAAGPNGTLGDYLKAVERLRSRSWEPLLLLWNLARIVSDVAASRRAVSVVDVEHGLGDLHARSHEGADRLDAPEPFWALQREPLLWEISGSRALGWPDRSEPPSRDELAAAAVRGGFPEELDERVRSDVEFRDGFARGVLGLVEPTMARSVPSLLDLEGLGVDVGYVATGLQALLEHLLSALSVPAHEGSFRKLKGLVEQDVPQAVRQLSGAGYGADGQIRARPAPDIPSVRVVPQDRVHLPGRGSAVVYLFAADGSSVHLCLACTTDNVRRKAIRKRALDLRDACGEGPAGNVDVRLRSSTPQARNLELGCAYAVRYERGMVPSEDTLAHDLGRFAQLLGTALDAGIDFETPENSHYVLKWSPEINPSTVDQARAVAERHGSVWWGNRGTRTIRAMAVDRLRELKRQLADTDAPTEAIVYRRGECWRARMTDVTDDPDGVRPELLTPTTDRQSCNLFFQLTEFEARDPSWPQRNLVPVADPRPEAITGALSNQTTPLEVYRRFRRTPTDEEIYLGAEPPLTMDWLEEQTLWDRDDLYEITDALVADSRPIILAGPPGTGKSWVATRLARYVTSDTPLAYKIVQFHPTYGYEEFIEGLRPVSDAGGISFEHVDGVVLEMAASIEDEEQRHVLVIDEMNRANLPRVFGELMYLLENRNVPVDLLHTRQFVLPGNLLFLGTMNTADRSIRSIDTALRRRFEIFDCPPSSAILDRFYSAGPNTNEVDGLVEGFERLNDELENLVDRHHTVGHTFFMDRAFTPRRLRNVWRRQLLPLIEEYFFEQPDQVQDFALPRFWPSIDADD